MTTLIQCIDLNVSIADALLLTRLNLNVEQGDYLCILGPNGAGKSTLLKCLMGLLSATNGKILFDDKSIKKIPQKALAQLVSYVPQANGRRLSFIVEDFVKMGRYPYHSVLSEWRPEDQNACDVAIEITEISPFLNRQMDTLSGGECQRVMIAAALSQQTPILLLDEPTSFLDPRHQVDVHRLINKLNKQHGITIIEVSHDLNHASQHGSHILALKQGQTIWQGKAGDFIEQQRLYTLYDQNFVFAIHPQTGAKIALADEMIEANE
ncbi:MAG: ABC transporter ATP-binding protein [Methylophaga sp.]|nr:MAG: ABC transporter ATP-binding protein [Methylophaga sp.]